MKKEADASATAEKLTAERVEEIFKGCLFDDGASTSGAVLVEGVRLKVGFHPERLEALKPSIRAMLDQLADDFHEKKGGGMSFLNACMTRDGDQWGEHLNIDQLLCLGLAAKMVKVLMPRELWALLPGQVPYFTVLTSSGKTDEGGDTRYLAKYPVLAEWVEGLRRFGGSVTDDDKGVCIATANNLYLVTANLDGDTYLGCVASAREPRRGETHLRCSDLADGKFSLETWMRILTDIVAYEMGTSRRSGDTFSRKDPLPNLTRMNPDG